MRKDEKEYIDIHMMALRAELKAGSDMMNYRFDKIESKQDLTNSRVTKLENTTQLWAWGVRNWYFVVALMMGMWFGIEWLSDNIDIKSTIEKQLNIELNEKVDKDKN